MSIHQAAVAWPGEAAGGQGRALTVLPDGETMERRVAAIGPSDPTLKWYLIRAATRREARAEESLIEAGFAVYLPRAIRWRRVGPIKDRVSFSLFGGYMFVGLRPSQSLYGVEAIDAVHGVVRFGAGRDPETVLFAEILGIIDQEVAGEYDKSRRAKGDDPERGEPIAILSGHFKGFPAEFVKRTPDERIEMLLNMFGRKTKYTLDADKVGRLGSDEPLGA